MASTLTRFATWPSAAAAEDMNPAPRCRPLQLLGGTTRASWPIGSIGRIAQIAPIPDSKADSLSGDGRTITAVCGTPATSPSLSGFQLLWGVIMRNFVKVIGLGVMCFTFTGCQVTKTKDAKLPKVEVKTTEGQLPAYNIQGPDVQIGEKTHTFKTPTIHVTTPNH
jgi:hypothetical protein